MSVFLAALDLDDKGQSVQGTESTSVVLSGHGLTEVHHVHLFTFPSSLLYSIGRGLANDICLTGGTSAPERAGHESRGRSHSTSSTVLVMSKICVCHIWELFL